MAMQIKLKEIIFTKEEIISFLKKNNYKIETHNATDWKSNAVSLKRNVEYAIKKNEEFNKKYHKPIDETFKDLIQNRIKEFVLSLSY